VEGLLEWSDSGDDEKEFLFIDESVMQGGTFIAILESGDRKERPAVGPLFSFRELFLDQVSVAAVRDGRRAMENSTGGGFLSMTWQKAATSGRRRS